MILIWSASAEKDRDNIVRFIAEDDIDSALAMDKLFSDYAYKLVNFPRLGHAGRVKNTFELLVHTHYILVYQINDNCIEILAIVHTSRQYPPS